jgi:hypothetical protein
MRSCEEPVAPAKAWARIRRVEIGSRPRIESEALRRDELLSRCLSARPRIVADQAPPSGTFRCRKAERVGCPLPPRPHNLPPPRNRAARLEPTLLPYLP